MNRTRLSGEAIAAYLRDVPDELCDLVLELREFVLATAPGTDEAIKFNSLCYTKPNHPYGAIGGNVCGIGVHKGRVLLSFIHGAFLPDPDGVLEGTGKAKRHVSILDAKDIRRRAFTELIRASLRYEPREDAGL